MLCNMRAHTPNMHKSQAQQSDAWIRQFNHTHYLESLCPHRAGRNVDVKNEQKRHMTSYWDPYIFRCGVLTTVEIVWGGKSYPPHASTSIPDFHDLTAAYIFHKYHRLHYLFRSSINRKTHSYNFKLGSTGCSSGDVCERCSAFAQLLPYTKVENWSSCSHRWNQPAARHPFFFFSCFNKAPAEISSWEHKLKFATHQRSPHNQGH